MGILAISACLLAIPAEAYPIPPRPLRQLYHESDLVIVAKAGQTVQGERREGLWEDSKVVLTVEKVVKGKFEGKDVTVFYCPDMCCPAPDHYPNGRTVLAFLEWSEKLKGYHAPGLSYASKVLDANDLKVYLQRLDEVSKIPREKRGDQPSDETLEWLVKCVEHPATRWEGAHEFFGPTVWVRRNKDDAPPEPIPSRRLSNAQWKRIIDSFITPRKLVDGDYLILALLKDASDPRIDAFLIGQLKQAVAGKEPSWGGSIMKTLSIRLGLGNGTELAARFCGLDYSDKDGQLALMKKFLTLIGEK